MANFTGYKLQDTPFEEMKKWAEGHVHFWRPHVELKDDITGEIYLQRWRLLPPNKIGNIYLHLFLGNDPGPELHDHRYKNRSWLLSGHYIEHLKDGEIITCFENSIIEREATDLHRIELIDKEPVISLFFCGPEERQWGFMTSDGWKQHEEYHRWVQERNTLQKENLIEVAAKSLKKRVFGLAHDAGTVRIESDKNGKYTLYVYTKIGYSGRIPLTKWCEYPVEWHTT